MIVRRRGCAHGSADPGRRNWKTYLDQMQALGFDLIRLPFSGDAFVPGRMPRNVDYGLNPALYGKTTLELLDQLVAECEKRGIRIILDHHRIQAASSDPPAQSGGCSSAPRTDRRARPRWGLAAVIDRLMTVQSRAP